jgi:hypothetical protein
MTSCAGPGGLIGVSARCCGFGGPVSRPGSSGPLLRSVRRSAAHSGDGRAPIESSAFLVAGSTFTRVGRKGEIPLPAGATRVDLTGKTVIPALIDTHNHLGWTNQRTNVATKQSYTRESVIDHLQRYAYYGVAATLSMGLDRWDVNPDMPYQLRNEIIPNCRAVSHGGPGDCGDADGGTRGRLSAWGSVRCADGSRRPGAGARAEGQERRDDQDLGGRPAEDGAEAAGQRRTRRSSTRRTRTRCASSRISSISKTASSF